MKSLNSLFSKYYSSVGCNSNVISIISILMLNLIICDCSRENVLISGGSIIDVSMPGVRPTMNDHYLCTSVNIEDRGTQYIHAYEPNSNADRAHHMLLFTCDDVDEDLLKDGWWDCGHHYTACKNMRIIYAWAKNAQPTVLPKDVGFRIGVESNIKNLVLQVHYAHPLPVGTQDKSGFFVYVSPDEPRYLAGILLMFRYDLDIPPKTEKIHGDMNCPLLTPAPIHPFAYRVHTHKLGVVVAGYKIDHTSGLFHEIGKGNPQWPQAFYPIKDNMTIEPNDYIAARCTYSTVDFDKSTKIGQTAGDEMCNMYIMFYTQSRDPEDHYLTCGNEKIPEISLSLPSDSDVPLPRNLTLEEHAKGHHHTSIDDPLSTSDQTTNKSHAKKRPGASTEPINGMNSEDFTGDQEMIPNDNRLDAGRKLRDSAFKTVSTWPDPSVKLGQASGVDFDTEGNVVVFHRADRVWDYATFDNQNIYQQKNLGPIQTDTIFIIHPKTGKILHQWGKDMFYMPHDITVDTLGNFWLTDVALHQVFKYEPGTASGPSLTLGVKFEPGKDDRHFCKPAAVAVLSNGDFFVADGYCNSRIIKFNKKGEKILQWGREYQPGLFSSVFNKSPPPYSFQIPHALALAEDRNLLCVADRENGRIQCFNSSNGKFEYMIETSAFGGRLFSVAYSSNDGGFLYAVNGPSRGATVQGFIIPLSTRQVSSVFKPSTGFGSPHDVAVSKNGADIYVVEITQPYKVWKFSKNETYRGGKSEDIHSNPISSSSSLHPFLNHDDSGPTEPKHPIQPSQLKEDLTATTKEIIVDDSFGASIVIMAFLTIPLLLMIGVGAIIRLRSSGWFRRKDTKSFAEFFPPSAGFEKLRMDESESDNSDSELEEFSVSSYRKANA